MMTGTPRTQAATIKGVHAEADTTIIGRLGVGDMDAAAELYDRHSAQVLGLARRILRNDEEAEEVVQDVFSQAWRSAPRFDPSRGTVIGWLLIMTRTRAIDRLRARRSRPDLIAGPYPDSLPAPGMAASDLLLSDEQAERVREALLALPQPQRQVIELAYYDGLTQSEIAERLTEPVGTVKTRIRSALAALRQRLRS